jgi:hypothetical protein
MGIHVQSCKTYLSQNSVINMGTKLYNKMPGYKRNGQLQGLEDRVEIISFISCFLLSGGICLFVIYNV